jgi:hypothetical protein
MRCGAVGPLESDAIRSLESNDDPDRWNRMAIPIVGIDADRSLWGESQIPGVLAVIGIVL